MEKYQSLQTLCQLGIAFFSILAIISGYGAYHFGEKKDALKAKTQNETTSKDSASQPQTTYHITGDLVQGDKVDKRQEINAPSALIVTKNQSGGNNTVNYFQNEYKEIDEDIKQTISKKLNALSIKFPKAPKAIIEIESGNTQRHNVALELESLLAKNNLGFYPKGNTYMNRFPDHPISVFINPSNKIYTQSLIGSLDVFISGEFEIIEDENFSSDFIKIYLNGQPLFEPNGKVKFQ